MNAQQALQAADWSTPREVQTKFGPRLVSEAKATEELWSAYRTDRETFRQAGVNPSQYKGEWRFTRWTQIDTAMRASREATRIASEAKEANDIIPSPEGLEYMPFQRAGIAFARRVGNCLIADEMGLGKTIQAIGFINADPSIHRVLVVTKAKLKLNWHRELTRWLVRPMTVGIVEPDCWPSTDVAICNYDILHKWGRKLEFNWDLVVADEVQACKNPRARRTRALLGWKPTKKEARASLEKRLLAAGTLHSTVITADDIIAEMVRIRIAPIPSNRRLALTGTPIENRPIEIQPVLAWLQPHEKRWAYWSFAKRYCGMDNNGYGVDVSGASNLDELRRTLRESVMVRRRKADVLTDLPPKTRQVIELEPDDDSEAALKAERRFMAENSAAIEAAQAQLELAKTGTDDEFKAAVAELQTSMQVAFTEMAKLRHATALAKVPAIIEHLRDAIEERESVKVLVFAHHRDVLAQLHSAFPGSILVTGETPQDDAQASVDRFQRDPKAGPFFGSIRATGEGITLTAADYVVFAEQDWVPGKMLQCEDRAHRIGQRDNVTCHYLVVAGSIDGKVMRTLVDKMAIIERALDRGSEAWQQAPMILPTGYAGAKRTAYHDEGAGMTDQQIAAVHRYLKVLAGMCDGARTLDGCGFNKVDAAIGQDLARRMFLTPAQGALGRRIVRKYQKQLGEVEDCG